ncbi:MAG: peptide chain release factor-like protein [Calditrichaeota bacterium]|nr:MAG: peptide chain release factor-like protein [Calditrichota bacterium]
MNAGEAGSYQFDPENLENEIEITTFKSSGPGGQKKNKTESAVRIKHSPTGIIVIATESRSQHKNRELAFARLVEKLQRLQEKPKPRKPTKIPPKAREQRLHEKHLKSVKKQWRRPPQPEDI